MTHIDTIYHFGTRIEPIWITMQDAAREFLFSEGKLWAPHAGKRKKGKQPNLATILERVEAETKESRSEKILTKYRLLNNAAINRLPSLKSKHVILTDMTTPTVIDPKFYTEYATELALPARTPGYPGTVCHEPYSPQHALTDAMLLMSMLNPDAWSGTLILPVMSVLFPTILGEDELHYAFPEKWTELDKEYKLGNKTKTMKTFFGEPSIGTFEAHPASLDLLRLTDLITQNPSMIARKIEKLTKIGITPEDAKQQVLDELPYEHFLKREIMAATYAQVLLQLPQAVIYAAKGSIAADIIERATTLLKQRGHNVTIPFIAEGPLDPSKKSPYRECEQSALERLNGYVLAHHKANKGRTATTKRVDVPEIKQLKLNNCPHAPVQCEAVYPELQSCARKTGETTTCSLDLYEDLKQPEILAVDKLGKEWLDWFNTTTEQPIAHLAELVDKKCQQFRIYTIEQIAWLLTHGPNYEVHTATTTLDEQKLPENDKRRLKARQSWHTERQDHVIAPFMHTARLAKNPIGRISSFGLDCNLARIIAANDLPPKTHTSEAAAFGTALHYLANGHKQDILHAQIWQQLGIQPAQRNQYTELEIMLEVDGEYLSGHSDGVLIKAPQDVIANPRGKRADLIIVDYKSGMKTPNPKREHIIQLGSYAIAYKQLNPEIQFENFYLVVVNKPFMTEALTQPPISQAVTIIKVRNDAQDPFYQEIKKEHEHFVTERKRLLTDSGYLKQFKQEQEEAKACQDGENSGCFPEQRAKCAKIMERMRILV